MKKQNTNYRCPKTAVFVLIMILLIVITGPAGANAADLSLSDKGYSLKQVIVLSRHNIRAPLSTKGSVLEQVTPNTWYNWSAKASELSLRGGVLETEMGQYFRKWLEQEGLIPENYHPADGEVRIYSNSKQRTIATARYFSAGLAPTANIDVEYHMDFDKMDPVFTPALNFAGDAYTKAAVRQIMKLFGGRIKALSGNYALLADVIDMDRSESYSDYEFADDNVIILNKGSEPAVQGPLKLGTQISDALVLQYYEESDPVKAAFGRELSEEQWHDICEIKEVYGEVLFGAPMVAANVANPLVKEIYSEINTEGRLFTFLCGHDSNIVSVLAALKAEDYSLPDTVETSAPIGCKLVFSKWESKKGRIYWSADLVYQSTGQLKYQPILDLDNSPVVYHLGFQNVKANKHGLIKNKDFRKLFTKAMKEYDSLYQKYSR